MLTHHIVYITTVLLISVVTISVYMFYVSVRRKLFNHRMDARTDLVSRLSNGIDFRKSFFAKAVSLKEQQSSHSKYGEESRVLFPLIRIL